MKIIQVEDHTHYYIKLLAAQEGVSMKDLIDKLLDNETLHLDEKSVKKYIDRVKKDNTWKQK